jgi:lyso-ornithine lipid O-acyltransferase
MNQIYVIFRSALRLFVLIPFTLLIYFLSYVPVLNRRKYFSALYRIWSALFVWVFSIRRHIHNRSGTIPLQYILVSNHPAGVDVIWLPSAFPVRPLSKKDVLDWPFIGRIAKKGGVLFVDREKASSRNASLITCTKALRGGDNILIFPEGGCKGKQLNPFQKGAFELSIRTGIPVLPVYLFYEDQETYSWGETAAHHYIGRLLMRAVNRNAHLYIFDPFKPEDFNSSEDYRNEVFRFYTSTEKTIKNGT